MRFTFTPAPMPIRCTGRPIRRLTTAPRIANLNWIEFEQTAVGVKVPGMRHIARNVKIVRYGRECAVDVAEDVESVSLLSLSGRVIESMQVSGARVYLPSPRGAGILLVRYRAGAEEVVRVVGW